MYLDYPTSNYPSKLDNVCINSFLQLAIIAVMAINNGIKRNKISISLM